QFGRHFTTKHLGREQRRQADRDGCVTVGLRMPSHFIPKGLIPVTNRNVMLILQQPGDACARTAKVFKNMLCLRDKLVRGRKRREGKTSPGVADPPFKSRVAKRQKGW